MNPSSSFTCYKSNILYRNRQYHCFFSPWHTAKACIHGNCNRREEFTFTLVRPSTGQNGAYTKRSARASLNWSMASAKLSPFSM
uniref:Uncharacterized protein n=1 Tax=Arundo donax TaxID=35708 RepID=A0A0A9C510_ARUDO